MDVAIRDAMLPKLDAAKFFQSLRDVGASAVELEVAADDTTPHLLRDDGAPHSVADDVSLARLKSALHGAAVRVSAVLLATDFSSPDPNAHVEWAIRATHAARDLGAPAVRIDPLSRDRQLSGDVVRERFVRATLRALRGTEDTGVALGIENHGPMANDPEFLDEVFAALPDPRLGLTLDTGNFYWFGFPLEEVYRVVGKYAPRARHTHLKNINYPPDLAHRRRDVGLEYKQYCCPLHEGNLDLRRLVEILGGAGYDGDLCVEDESLFKHPPERRVEVLRREVEALRRAMQEVGA
jgi:sugar phosphate isomerase/epimerase